ncbi:hypothetical protein [Actinomadura rugatobispora]|uniref:Uncharacterized protein n=1 Tax=Actinomadura rugatobispora TaxID=1994 RepID=A0ABW0ZQG2_9ACTN|nr:hypothetical protein GCM10010200_035840 [Actinomadura rugatobispora]
MTLTEKAQWIASFIAAEVMTVHDGINLLIEEAQGRLTIVGAADMLARSGLDDWTPLRRRDGRWWKR